MVKFLSVALFSVFFVSTQAYITKECPNDTIVLETYLLKMSADFASLAYFKSGVKQLKKAWNFLPTWLLNCVPFIVTPNNLDYDLEDLDIQETNNQIIIEGKNYHFSDLRIDYEFQNCVEILKHFISEIDSALGFAKNKEYQSMIDTLKSLGSIGPEFTRVCFK